MPDRIALRAPLSDDFVGVVRLIVGGVAERADLGFEDMDDLQLAVERLLAEAVSLGYVALRFEIGPGRVRTSVGPLHSEALARALQEPDDGPATLTLGRILSTVVSSYGVETVADGHIVVRLEKVMEDAG